MKNILFIAKLSEFKNENSPNRYCFLKYLEEKPNIMLLNDESNNTLNSWLKINRSQFNPDIIIYYFLSRGERLTKIAISDFKNTIKQLNIPSVMIFEDSHYFDLVKKLYNLYEFNHFIQLGYNSNVTDKLANSNIPFELWDQYIDTDKFKNRNNDIKYDFLFYGFVDSNIYPLRTKIYNVLKELQKSHPHIRIKIIEHGSYNKHIIKVPTQEDLSILLNQARFAFATSSIHDLFLKKYVEISLSGTTIIGNIPTNFEELLKNKIINIDFNASTEEIKEIILKSYNNNYFDIELNSSSLTNVLKTRYNYDTGYNKLNTIVDNIILDYNKKITKVNKLNKVNNNLAFDIDKFIVNTNNNITNNNTNTNSTNNNTLNPITKRKQQKYNIYSNISVGMTFTKNIYQ
jgi:hypothetical protein